MTTKLECISCGHKFPSTEVELTNLDITDEYFRINWNCPKCNVEGLTLFINNPPVVNRSSKLR
jgi:hypothetical protein